ncbi:carbon-phosphorus lyase complex subunit PhnI [Hwanghaeella grinnelliae]|uniref:Carbon-phosphorus lyase complex subunit PhnI n=1 Tax=Hwanghaeella grinnelliae TaxID=2500179 RepID=A0A3S2Z6D1_9PROT|nr:carbon-phosphorus lyase complex subunit PhnI [Hwanghaeella grinnelliae]RVU35157.1 carbon-phosphorus lyase complex subunit PhnI [Hwanghaeella grinnelliae]
MYVAVKGGEKAIDNAHRLLAEDRRGNPDVPELTIDQIREQLKLSIDRVMTEGSLYDRDLAALAIKQARGDLIEAIFLIRAYRTTLPRFGYSQPVETSDMVLDRRISATFKDLPGGQVLGPTFDYTHRLLDFMLAAEGKEIDAPETVETDTDETPRVLEILARNGLMEPPDGIETDGRSEAEKADVGDLTRDPLSFPTNRDLRLQNLARGDEGFLLAMGYSTQRGYGRNHPFAGEIRFGTVSVEFVPEELGFPIEIGEIEMTECDMVNAFAGSAEAAPQFTRGYGLTFGHCERKAMSMALVDRALRSKELGEPADAPAQDEEFVLSHSDNIQATGFVEHLKLPHYVDFQSELAMVRRMRAEFFGEDDDASTAEAAE